MVINCIQNPVYCGKIAYGRRKTEKVHGTLSDYHLVEQDKYSLADESIDAFISKLNCLDGIKISRLGKIDLGVHNRF